MGVIIMDKTADYGSQFDAVISAAEGAISMCYLGNADVPALLRMGEFNTTGKVGSYVPTGDGAVLRDEGGIMTLADSGTANPSRFVHSWKNASAKCCYMVVAHVAAGGGIFSFAGARVKLGENRLMGVRDAAGTGRDLSTAAPDTALCYFLNSNETSYQNGWISSAGAITRVAYSNDAKNFTTANATCYIGGVGYGSAGFPGPNIFYASAAFDRFLTDDELIAQAQQLIRYANTIGAGVA